VEYCTDSHTKRATNETRDEATEAGPRGIAGEERLLGAMVLVIHTGKQAVDAVMLEMGRMVAESVMLIEREEVTGPDDYPMDPALKKWAHEQGSIYLGDQKVPVMRPRLRHVEEGEVTLQSYARMRAPWALSEELLEKILRGYRHSSTPTPSSTRRRPSGCSGAEQNE